jgi:predicted nucleic acid-binding protein
MAELTDASSVYIDTNIFVYWVEAVEPFFQNVRELFEGIGEAGCRVVTSEITVAECIYKPARDGDDALIALYERLFEQSGDIDLAALDGAIVKKAAKNGGILGLKLIDAVHYLTALENGCDLFVTSDERFKSGPAMRVLRIGG